MPSLGNDLATIRKQRDLSLDDIHDATKIPKHVINSIEDNSIFKDFQENITYIRSYVRSYAKALSIDENRIIYALDKQENDEYDGSLQEISENTRTFEYDDETNGDEIEQPEDEMIHDHLREFSQGHDSYADSKIQPVDSPNVDSVDWADMGRKFQPLASTKSKVWVSILILVFAAAGGFFFFMYNTNSNSTTANQNNASNQQGPQTTAASDSLQLNIVPSVDEDTNALANATDTATFQNQSLEALPDTLTLVVYAAYGKLEPVRVYTDIMDGINPYWIEQTEAIRFNFVNTIHIRGQFSRMVLLMNGHVIENFREQFYNSETRLLEISRSFFEQDPQWLEPSADSLGIDAPPPSIIRERPIFN